MVKVHGHNGFTLIEGMIVIMIIAIIAVFSYGSFARWRHTAEADSLRQSLLSAISFARHIAYQRTEKIILCKSANQITCGGEWQQGIIVQSSVGQVLQTLSFKHQTGQVFVRLFPRGRENLVFLPNGRAEVENGSFWYCFAGHKNPYWAIVFNRFGRARTILPDKQGQIIDSHHKPLQC